MRVQIGLFRFVSFDESIGEMTHSVLQVVRHGVPSFEVARALTKEIVATSRLTFTDHSISGWIRAIRISTLIQRCLN